jgi:hypothetical protein
LAHFVDAVLHGLRVFCTRTIEHAFDASNIVLGPLFVWQVNGLRVTSFDQHHWRAVERENKPTHLASLGDQTRV